MFGMNWTGGAAPRSAQPEHGFSGMSRGFVEGTHVATAMGWRPVENLVPGDMVLTFDGGMQQVQETRRGELWAGDGPCPSAIWPLFVPAGTVGNRNDLLVLPDQGILVETEAASDQWGDPYTLIPAAALEEFEGVERQDPYGTVEVVQPILAEDQVIFTDHGALFHCAIPAGENQLFTAPKQASNYHIMGLSSAKQLLRGAMAGQVDMFTDFSLSVA